MSDVEAGTTGGRAEKRAASRRRIIDAAREVFFRDGFMEANLDEVARIAGVAKGTLYRYFDSKAELYVAVLAHNGEIFEQKMRDSVADTQVAAPDLIRVMGRFYFDHWMRNPEYFQIFWAIENQSVIGELPQGVIDEVTRLWEKCVELLARIIERGIEAGDFGPCDAWEVADILWTLANGLIQTESSPARRRLRRRGLDATFTDAVELVLHGLAATGRRS